jgi:DNA-binding CsgD family transcriptional regulator
VKFGVLEPDILDLIYQAASVPEIWPDVLVRLANLSEAKGSGLVCFDATGANRFIATESYKDAFIEFSANSHRHEQRRPRKVLAEGLTGFTHDLELFTQAELDADPVYINYMHPYGLKWGAGTVIPTPSSDLLVFDLSRTKEQGPFDRETLARLDPLRPHLARAALMAHRLGLHAAQAATDALDTIGIPGAVVSSSGRVLAANVALEALAPQVSFSAFDRIHLGDPRADSILRRALEYSEPSLSDIRSIPLRAADNRHALVVHVVPVRRTAQDIFSGATAIVVVTPVVAPNAPLANVLTGLLDLTPAEAQVARAIARGENVEQIALSHGRSRETVRSQVKSILDKTGTARQVDLTILLSGISRVST